MNRVDRQYSLQVFDLPGLPPGLQIGKYMAKHHLIDKNALPGLRIQLLLLLPQIVKYFPRKQVDGSFITG